MSEDDIHKLICAWLVFSLPRGSVFHHSPNEGRRHVSYNKRLTTMGTRWGWPDLEIFTPPAGFRTPSDYRPIFIEVKSKKGRLTANQKLVQQELRDAGCYVFEARSMEDAAESLAPVLRLLRHPPYEMVGDR